jgi:hypothetical protein
MIDGVVPGLRGGEQFAGSRDVLGTRAAGEQAVVADAVEASLAQIGEFSFILAGLGVALGILPPDGRDLIIAGALLSITVNPLLFATIDPAVAWLRKRPPLLTHIERQESKLATLPERTEGLQGHAIIVGYGRVGSIIGDALKAHDLPFLVVEENRRRVEALRRRDISAVYGDATAAGVLDAANVDRADLLVVAAPRGFQTQRITSAAGGLSLGNSRHSAGNFSGMVEKEDSRAGGGASHHRQLLRAENGQTVLKHSLPRSSRSSSADCKVSV